MSYDYAFKCTVVGGHATGQTAISLRFTGKRFHDWQHEPTTCLEFSCRDITIGGERIRLKIWDIPNYFHQKMLNSITRSIYRGAVIALVVYDVTDTASFKYVSKLLKEIRDFASPYTDVVVVVVGNKIDLINERSVARSDGETFARENGLEFMGVSAKAGQNIEAAFMNTAEEIYEKLDAGVFSITDAENAIRPAP